MVGAAVSFVPPVAACARAASGPVAAQKNTIEIHADPRIVSSSIRYQRISPD
jgi:hypothetical protein